MTTTLKVGSVTTLELPAGQKITVTTAALSYALVERFTGTTVVSKNAMRASESVVLGEYFIPQNIRISALKGTVTYDVTQSTDTVRTGASVALTGSVTFTTGDGAPEDAARATLSRNPTGDDNALTFTAVEYGARGNAITIAYTDPGANDASLAVSVNDNAIAVSLATDNGGTITSTAADVLAAIEANSVANAMVTVAINTGDTGSGDDGSGVVTALSAAAMTGGAGTGIDTAAPGSVYVDYTNGTVYENRGTLAAPIWLAPAHLHLYGAGVPVDYTDGSPPATGEGVAYPGAIYTDITNGDVYRNSGSRAEPVWTQLADVP